MERVIGFFGGDSQTGTTMLAWSFAERLSEKGRRVLLIFGSGKDDRFFFDGGTGTSIDDLKAALRSGKVERDDVFACMEKRKSMWILPGTKNSLSAEYFLENTFQILLEELEADFDEVVIDGGSDLRLGLTISALHICSHRCFVITQQLKCLHRYIQNRGHLLKPLGIDGQVVLNQYRKDPSLFLKKDVCRMLGTETLIVIPFVEGGWQTEMERKNLLTIPKIAKGIEHLLEEFLGGEKKVKRWKKLFT